MARPNDVEDFINAAEQHGIDSEPDHEVGDLQDLARALWKHMSEQQRLAFLESEDAKEVWETQGQDWDD